MDTLTLLNVYKPTFANETYTFRCAARDIQEGKRTLADYPKNEWGQIATATLQLMVSDAQQADCEGACDAQAAKRAED